MMNKLLVSTLNICIVTFPWDDEPSSQGNVTIQMLRVDTSSLFIIPRKCNNTDVERGHKQFVHHPKEM
jgi:hypothetical protein